MNDKGTAIRLVVKLGMDSVEFNSEDFTAKQISLVETLLSDFFAHLSPLDSASVTLKLDQLLTQGRDTMGLADDIKAGQERAATALTNVAADVRELVTIATNPSGVSEADGQIIKEKGEAIASGLEAVAALYASSGEGGPSAAKKK